MLPCIRLSSTCAVFAQSEIVELIAEGVSEETILKAGIEQVLTQAKRLLGKVECGTVALSGGLTRISGIGDFAQTVLDKQVVIPPDAADLAAVGCALAARAWRLEPAQNRLTGRLRTD